MADSLTFFSIQNKNERILFDSSESNNVNIFQTIRKVVFFLLFSETNYNRLVCVHVIVIAGSNMCSKRSIAAFGSKQTFIFIIILIWSMCVCVCSCLCLCLHALVFPLSFDIMIHDVCLCIC